MAMEEAYEGDNLREICSVGRVGFGRELGCTTTARRAPDLGRRVTDLLRFRWMGSRCEEISSSGEEIDEAMTRTDGRLRRRHDDINNCFLGYSPLLVGDGVQIWAFFKSILHHQ